MLDSKKIDGHCLWNPYIVLRDTDHGVLKNSLSSLKSILCLMDGRDGPPSSKSTWLWMLFQENWMGKTSTILGGYLLNGGSYCWLHWTLAKLGSWVVDRNRLKQLQPWTIFAFNVLQELLAGSWLGLSRLQGRTWLKHHLSKDLFVYLYFCTYILHIYIYILDMYVCVYIYKHIDII